MFFKTETQKQIEVAQKAVLQGNQQMKLIALFNVIRKEALKEYNEDNKITVEYFLLECFADTLETIDVNPATIENLQNEVKKLKEKISQMESDAGWDRDYANGQVMGR